VNKFIAIGVIAIVTSAAGCADEDEDLKQILDGADDPTAVGSDAESSYWGCYGYGAWTAYNYSASDYVSTSYGGNYGARTAKTRTRGEHWYSVEVNSTATGQTGATHYQLSAKCGHDADSKVWTATATPWSGTTGTQYPASGCYPGWTVAVATRVRAANCP
jgi:hypothetical protein